MVRVTTCHLAPGAGHAPGQQIKLEIRHLEAGGVGGDPVPTQQGLDAGEELCERKGLGEIVIPAGLQAPHAIIHTAES
jgi:hypothetical protein